MQSSRSGGASARSVMRRSDSAHSRVSGSFGRRSLFGLFAASAVGVASSGCASPSSDRPSAPESSGVEAPSEPTTVPPSEERSDGGSETDTTPSREEIAARYEDAAPGEFGLDISGVQLALPDGCSAAALTLDACGGATGSGVDAELLEHLRQLDIAATLFINRRWAQENPSTMETILDEPLFEIQNHGDRHRPLSVSGASAYGLPGTASAAEVYDEIMGGQDFLHEEYGVTCSYFRSGTAHLDEASVQICRDLGLTPVNFTVNLDDGATLPAADVAARAGQISSGDIALGHFNQPDSGTSAGLRDSLPQLVAGDLRFITLQQAC